MIDASAFSVSWNSGVAACSCSGSQAYGRRPEVQQVPEESRLACLPGQELAVGEGQELAVGADERRNACCTAFACAIGILASAVQLQFMRSEVLSTQVAMQAPVLEYDRGKDEVGCHRQISFLTHCVAPQLALMYEFLSSPCE